MQTKLIMCKFGQNPPTGSGDRDSDKSHSTVSSVDLEN